jgi:hypothetical protein
MDPQSLPKPRKATYYWFLPEKEPNVEAIMLMTLRKRVTSPSPNAHSKILTLR